MIPGRLQWRARRGLLELDLLLGVYLESGWSDLNDAEREAFEALLTTPDLELVEWLRAPETSPAAWQSLVRAVRDASAAQR